MTNNEDFRVFAYPALFISSMMISIIPAYIASKKNKNFWTWWFSTVTVLAILLFVVIKTQAFSLLIYLLAIVPIVSILALFPKLTVVPKVKITRGVVFLWIVLVVLLVFGTELYFYLFSPLTGLLRRVEKTLLVNLAVAIVLACLGFASFINIVSKRRARDIIGGIFCVFLFALPILLSPSRAYAFVDIPRKIFERDLLFTLVVINLINAPIAGVFVWMGICSGCTAIAILFNDKYKIVNNAATLVLRTINKIVFNVPSIHFSDNPLLSSTVLGFVVLGVLIFRILFTPNESWIFLWPLVYLCLVFPMFLLCVAGAIFSSVVIARSINQKKSPYAAGIFLCGILASWGAVSTKFFINAFGRPAALLMAYGLVSGFTALLLWVISDLLGSRRVENL